MNHNTVSRAAVMRSDLLGPLKWRIAGPCPADCIMWKGCWIAPVIQMRHVNLSGVDDSIQSHHLVIRAFRPAFRARSVVADNVNEQGVIQDTHFPQGIHQASYLIVSMLCKTGEGFHLPRLEFFLVRRLGIPGRNFLGTLC